MATTVNSTSVAAMIKELYPQKRIEKLWKLRYPFLSMVKKADRFEGSSIRIPVEIDHPAASRTFSVAQSNYYPTSSEVFDVTRVRDYAIGRIDAETMRSTRSNVGGFVRVLDREIENLLLTLQKRTAIGLYRDTTGVIGEVASVASSVITLKNKSDVANFSVGQTVLADDTTDGETPTMAANAVTAVNFDAGTITMTTISSAATDNYLINSGDENGGASDKSFAGLAAWLPVSASPGALFGVTRTTNTARLAGHYLDDTSLSIEESIQTLAAKITFTGGAPDYCFMNPLQLKNLALELDTKVVRDPGGTGMVGFSGVTVATAAGMINVVADPACPENRAYLLEMKSWELLHLDGLPHIVDDEGLRMLRVSDADQVEVRCRLWGNLACHAPGHNGVFTLAAAS